MCCSQPSDYDNDKDYRTEMCEMRHCGDMSSMRWGHWLCQWRALRDATTMNGMDGWLNATTPMKGDGDLVTCEKGWWMTWTPLMHEILCFLYKLWGETVRHEERWHDGVFGKEKGDWGMIAYRCGFSRVFISTASGPRRLEEGQLRKCKVVSITGVYMACSKTMQHWMCIAL